MKFVWDSEKEEANWRKHRISFDEAAKIFSDEYQLTLFDEAHSQDEERWITLGMTPQADILLVSHTYRSTNDQEFVRIISARPATGKEKEVYQRRRPKR